MSDTRPPIRSSAKEFTLILVCAVALSFAFVHWMKSSRPPLQGGLKVGQPAPELLAELWVNGDGPAPGELVGEVYVVDAWATWCLPCRLVTPELVALHKDYAPRGVRFFGLTGEPTSAREQIEEWLEKEGITWPNGCGVAAFETLVALQADHIPTIWVVGRDGTIVWNIDSGDDDSLREALDRALAEEPPAAKPGADIAPTETRD